ncbi:MAG: hypothetical protein A2Y63_06480 [Candidatus Riflebacteria bacterium RBG_13_59_9]|nr:MAG: hypothetical protein A2Y63_06480 [Candidatus Riflebacteria bacterium RBG_13_59_9]
MLRIHSTVDREAAIRETAHIIRSARHLTAFTGAEILVEGSPRSRYDPRLLELDYFRCHPEKSWPILREIFYDHFCAARPNRAHEVLAAWEARGLLKALITQNVDSVQWN